MIKARMLAFVVAGAVACGSSVQAEDSFRIGLIDPLSGPAATTGEVGLKTWQFLAGEVNASGGLNGQKLEVVGYDNKMNPQETTIQAQKAIDSGVRLLVRANGSAPGVALNDFLNKFNERNPTKQTLYFDYAGADPAATNEKCSYWQVRWAANIDMKVLALASYLKGQADIKKLYLLNGDCSSGQGIQKAMRTNMAEKRPDVQIVGDELVPLMKVNDFAPYVEKIKASGADTVVTGARGQDFALLLKAAGEAGLKVKWYTFFAQGIGGATAVRQSGLPPHTVFEIYEAHANLPSAAYREEEKNFRAVVGSGQTMMYPGSINAMDMFAKAAKELKSNDVAKIVASLEGTKFRPRAGGEGWIRAEDHQVFQPLYVASIGPIEKDQGFDEENTGWGWRQIGEVKPEDTLVPTTCQMKRPL
jgi:branched-chain amino acid transport system substrate-binding protein